MYIDLKNQVSISRNKQIRSRLNIIHNTMILEAVGIESVYKKLFASITNW